jgi:small subunit ribosomal protein S10
MEKGNNMKKINSCIIHLQSFDSLRLQLTCNTLIEMAQKVKLTHKAPIKLPTHKSRITVLRSPHIDKKSREQFQIGTHKRVLYIENKSAHPNAVNEFIDSIRQHLYWFGIDIKIEYKYNLDINI